MKLTSFTVRESIETEKGWSSVELTAEPTELDTKKEVLALRAMARKLVEVKLIKGEPDGKR